VRALAGMFVRVCVFPFRAVNRKIFFQDVLTTSSISEGRYIFEMVNLLMVAVIVFLQDQYKL